MRAKRAHQQFCLRVEVRVERPVADLGALGDVSHPGAVVALTGERVRGRSQQPFAGLGGGDTGDASHAAIKKPFIYFVKSPRPGVEGVRRAGVIGVRGGRVVASGWG